MLGLTISVKRFMGVSAEPEDWNFGAAQSGPFIFVDRHQGRASHEVVALRHRLFGGTIDLILNLRKLALCPSSLSEYLKQGDLLFYPTTPEPSKSWSLPDRARPIPQVVL